MEDIDTLVDDVLTTYTGWRADHASFMLLSREMRYQIHEVLDSTKAGMVDRVRAWFNRYSKFSNDSSKYDPDEGQSVSNSSWSGAWHFSRWSPGAKRVRLSNDVLAYAERFASRIEDCVARVCQIRAEQLDSCTSVQLTKELVTRIKLHHARLESEAVDYVIGIHRADHKRGPSPEWVFNFNDVYPPPSDCEGGAWVYCVYVKNASELMLEGLLGTDAVGLGLAKRERERAEQLRKIERLFRTYLVLDVDGGYRPHTEKELEEMMERERGSRTVVL